MNVKRTSYSRSLTTVHMEKKLSTLIEDQNQCHVHVNMLLVQAKACSLYKDLSKGYDHLVQVHVNLAGS